MQGSRRSKQGHNRPASREHFWISSSAYKIALMPARALIPIENKRSFFDVSADVLEIVDPIFYGEVKQGVFKALGLDAPATNALLFY